MMMLEPKSWLGVALSATAVAAAPVEDSEPSPDKNRYHLFSPTPPAYQRELSADRPDKTDSPYTVDAGHFQVETDFVNLTYDRYNTDRNHTRTFSYEILPMTLKVGVLNSIDFQVAIGPHGAEQVEDKSASTRNG